ncbi:hypothetical protein LIER_31579 [Lithospermum erythrorhizon]|uniref:Rapid ALkalinization Factor n=1 Tax=Lithospermum erythrorhizon TaxID=34254 RepID=A0AAV3RWQ2_LITER
MACQKKILALSIAALMVCCLVMEANADASHINYSGMRPDGTPCWVGRDANCRPGKPANNYNRGCSKLTRCRGGNGSGDAEKGVILH